MVRGQHLIIITQGFHGPDINHRKSSDNTV